MCRQYGNAAKTALQTATERGWCTQGSFATFVNSVLARHDSDPISRATVANWENGRDNMPADVLLLLAKHCAPHEREVLDAYLGDTQFTAEPREGSSAVDVTAETLAINEDSATLTRLVVQGLANDGVICAKESPEIAELADRIRRRSSNVSQIVPMTARAGRS